MSLDDALNFIKRCEDESYEIGVVVKDIPGLTGHKKGEVVVFQTHDPRQDSENEKMFWNMHYGRDATNDRSVTLTVETPYSPKVIAENLLRGIHFLSCNTISRISPEYVEKVEGSNPKAQVERLRSLG